MTPNGPCDHGPNDRRERRFEVGPFRIRQNFLADQLREDFENPLVVVRPPYFAHDCFRLSPSSRSSFVQVAHTKSTVSSKKPGFNY
jgi:hypothetical protein